MLYSFSVPGLERLRCLVGGFDPGCVPCKHHQWGDKGGFEVMAAIGKTELIRRVAQSSGKSVKETSDLVNSTLDAIRDSLKSGEEVRLVGFGSFAVKTTAARTGVNPQTRAKIQVPSKQRVRFSPGKELNDAVAK